MKQLLAAFAIALCMTSGARAGVILHNVTEHKGANTAGSDGIVYVQNGMLRSEQRDAHGKVEHIMLFRDGAIWQIDVHAHSYTKMDRATMQAMSAQMPPQLRAMMEKMNGSGGAGKADPWRDTGRSEHVGRYDCHVWQRQKEEMCIVPFGALPGGGELKETLQQVGKVVKEVLTGSFLGSAANVLADYAKFDGVPAVTRRESGDSYLRSIEQKNLPADTFQVPEGFEQKQMPWNGAHAHEE